MSPKYKLIDYIQKMFLTFTANIYLFFTKSKNKITINVNFSKFTFLLKEIVSGNLNVKVAIISFLKIYFYVNLNLIFNKNLYLLHNKNKIIKIEPQFAIHLFIMRLLINTLKNLCC